MDKYLNELKEALDVLFDTDDDDVFVCCNNTVLVHDVELDKLKEFVERSKFKQLVHSVEYDYDYDYDGCGTVAKDRVVLYCTVLCEDDYNKCCDSCLKCEGN